MLCAVAIEQNNTPFCSKMDAEQGARAHLFSVTIKRATAAPNRGAAAPQHPAKRNVTSCASLPGGEGREGGAKPAPQRKKRAARPKPGDSRLLTQPPALSE